MERGFCFTSGLGMSSQRKGPREAVWEECGCCPVGAGSRGQAGTGPERPILCPGAGIPDGLLQRAAWSHSCFRKTARAAVRATVSTLGLIREGFHAGHCSGHGGVGKCRRADRAVCARWSEEGAEDQRHGNKGPGMRSPSGGEALSSGWTSGAGGAWGGECPPSSGRRTWGARPPSGRDG